MSGNLWKIMVLVALAAGCGAPPRPSLEAQRAAVEAGRPADPARLGWWRYLGGDAAGAAAAFEQAPADPLAALGRARLAADRLDPGAALAEAARAAAGPGLVGVVGRAWAEDLAAELRDGATALAAALGPAADRRQALPADAYTVRISFLPWLQLPTLHQRPPTLTADRAEALGRSWALQASPPRPDPDGLVLSRHPLPAGPASIELAVTGPAVVWRDGRLLAATTVRHHALRVLRFPAPGEGPLVVVWAGDRLPRAWRHADAPPATDDRAGPSVPDHGPGVDWVDRYLAAELAVLDADAASAEVLLADAPSTPAFAALRARHAELAVGVPAATARDEARPAWEAALPLAPAQAHLALGRLDWRRGAAEDALAHLDAALRLAPDAFLAHHTRLRLHLADGDVEAARRDLEAARASAADPCRLVDDEAALAESQPGGDARLLDLWTTCDRPLDAVRRLLDRARPGDALARLDALSPAARARPAARKLRARALLGLGRLAEAAAEHGAVEDLESGLAALDLRRALGQPGGTDADLATLVGRFPTDHEALQIVAAQPGWSGLADFFIDTDDAIAAFEAVPPQSGPAVRVVDHSILLFFKNGKSLRYVHEVLAVRSRDAAERFGEIGLPDGARLISLGTRKDDGRWLPGEEVPEKETITLPDLTSGDYVVARYLEPGDNGYLYDGGYLSPRVFFQGVDLPIFHQRFEVFAPDDVAPAVEGLVGSPLPTPIRLGERVGWRFDVHRVPLLPPEDDTPPPGLWLPSVRVGHDVVLADDLAYLRDRALARRRRTPRFDAWAKEAAGEGAPATRAARLARAVREGIDDDGGLIEADVTEALVGGHGNRGLVLSAALEAVGLPHRLLLARTRVHVPTERFLTIADFPYPLIELAGGFLLDPGPERAEPGFVPFTVAGGDVLQVWPADGRDVPAPLPAERQVHDRRQVEVRATWRKDGTLAGQVVDRLEGQEAIVIGHHLARLDPEQRPRLVERLLVGAVGAARVEHLDDPATQDPDGPLVLRYTFTAQAGDALALGLFPVQPASGHASAPERRTPLAITLPTDQTVVIHLESERPLAGRLVASEEIAGAHRFTLAVEQSEDAVTLRSHTVIPGGLIAPADYPAFAAWARAVEDAERVRLTAGP